MTQRITIDQTRVVRKQAGASMQLDTTFRGVDQTDRTKALRALEKCSSRFERLVEEPANVRMVVDEGSEVRVSLSVGDHRGDFAAVAKSHDVGAAVSAACDKIKSQMARHRKRRVTQRHDMVRKAG